MILLNRSVNRNTTGRDKDIYAKVVDIHSALMFYPHAQPHPKTNYPFECHTICRAYKLCIPGLTVVDGTYFGIELIPEENRTRLKPRYSAHSWLTGPDGAIMDVQPVGCISDSALLIVTAGDHQPFGSNLYIPDATILDDLDLRKIYRGSCVLADIMRKALRVYYAPSLQK